MTASSDFSNYDSETIVQEPSGCFMVGPSVPTSSILVKHGTKRPLEVGDEDSKPDDEHEKIDGLARYSGILKGKYKRILKFGSFCSSLYYARMKDYCTFSV